MLLQNVIDILRDIVTKLPFHDLIQDSIPANKLAALAFKRQMVQYERFLSWIQFVDREQLGKLVELFEVVLNSFCWSLLNCA